MSCHLKLLRAHPAPLNFAKYISNVNSSMHGERTIIGMTWHKRLNVIKWKYFKWFSHFEAQILTPVVWYIHGFTYMVCSKSVFFLCFRLNFYCFRIFNQSIKMHYSRKCARSDFFYYRICTINEQQYRILKTKMMKNGKKKLTRSKMFDDAKAKATNIISVIQ